MPTISTEINADPFSAGYDSSSGQQYQQQNTAEEVYDFAPDESTIYSTSDGTFSNVEPLYQDNQTQQSTDYHQSQSTTDYSSKLQVDNNYSNGDFDFYNLFASPVGQQPAPTQQDFSTNSYPEQEVT